MLGDKIWPTVGVPFHPKGGGQTTSSTPNWEKPFLYGPGFVHVGNSHDETEKGQTQTIATK